jgi:RNA polymerase sigma-70 factor (ECF subfamily)
MATFTAPAAARSGTRYDPHHDNDLLQRARAGEREAFDLLTSRHFDRLSAISVRILRNPADAEDNVQNVLCKAFVNLWQFKENALFSTWLIRITINEALMKLRRSSSENRHFQPDSEVFQQRPVDRLPSGQLNPEAQCIARDLASKACTSVPATLRDTFAMFAIEGWTHKEISKSYGVATQTIKSRIFRARRMMRESLQGAIE